MLSTTLFTPPRVGQRYELVKHPDQIDKKAAKTILVESFINEYQHLTPRDIKANLTTWRNSDTSVEKFYEDYFETELTEFAQGHLDYWVQATVDGKLAGWATFQREKDDQNSVYMNLLVVHPNYQRRSIGKGLVYALLDLGEIPNLNAIHLLLRKKNEGGRTFYTKLGFKTDPNYHRDDNFVDLNLLEGLTWNNPSPRLVPR